MLHAIESDTPCDVVSIDFWDPGDIPDWYGYCKIMTCLDCMTVFGIGSASGLKQIELDQATRWYFGNFFVPFGLPKIIVVEAN